MATTVVGESANAGVGSGNGGGVCREGARPKPTDEYVQEVRNLLVSVHRSIPESEFCGVGLVVCEDVNRLPRWPLAGAERPLDQGAVAAIRGASMFSDVHDGFHILSPSLTVTHTNQYITPPVAGLVIEGVAKAGFGARHMSALLASRLPTVICAGVLNTRTQVVIFVDGQTCGQWEV